MSLNRAQLFEVLRDAFNRAYPGDSQATLETLANLLTPVWDGSVLYSVKSTLFAGGAVGDGVTSDRNAIQAAIDWSAQNRLTVSIPDGNYLVNQPLYARAGASVVCTPRARLIRNYSTTGTTGLLMNETMTTPISNFRWSGGVLHNPSPATLAGNTVCLNANDSVIEDVFCDEWSSAGRAFLIFGNRLRLNRIRAVSAYDGGGIRYAGGDDFRCTDSYVECGDDCFQFVPGAASAGTLFDQPIARGQYVGCQGYSHNARLMVAGLVSTTETLHMTGSITDCAWIGVRGRGRQFGAIDNTDSTGKIARMDFIGCQCDSTGETGSPVGSFWVNRASGAGPVEDVRLSGCTILAPELEAVEINGASGSVVGKVTIDQSYLDKSRTSATETVITQYCDSFTIRGSTVVGNGNDVIVLGVGLATATNSVIDGNRIIEIDNVLSGIRLNSATGWVIRDNRFVERSGQTSARAVTYTASGATQGTVYPNDYSGLTASQKIFPNASNNTGNKVIGAGLGADATGAVLRWHESGQARTNFTATTTQTYTLPTAVPGQVFRFLVTGTGMMAIACTGTDVIRQGISVTTATTGRLTSTAQGNSVTMEAVDGSTWNVTSSFGTWVVT